MFNCPHQKTSILDLRYLFSKNTKDYRETSKIHNFEKSSGEKRRKQKSNVTEETE